MSNLNTTIWRVENKFGESCYSTLSTKEILYRHDYDILHHPLSQHDVGIWRKKYRNEICGFKTLKQALEWFSLWELFQLACRGFLLKRMRAKILIEGEKQVLASKQRRKYGRIDNRRNARLWLWGETKIHHPPQNLFNSRMQN